MAKAAAEKTADVVKFPAFELPKMEVPAALRDVADKAAEQAKEVYGKAKVAFEEAGDLVQDTYKTVSAGTNSFNLTALEATRTNVNAAFDHARDLMGAKTLAEVVEMQSSYLRARFEAVQGQAKDLYGIVQTTANDAGAPIKASVEKIFAQAK